MEKNIKAVFVVLLVVSMFLAFTSTQASNDLAEFKTKILVLEEKVDTLEAGSQALALERETLAALVADAREEIMRLQGEIDALDALDTEKVDILRLHREIKSLKNYIDTLKDEIKYLLAANSLAARPIPGLRHSRQGSTPANEKVAFLTFDDGPSGVTAQILDILKDYGIPATFFVNGRSSSHSIAMYKRIVEEGHVLGNHTYSHNWSHIYSSVDNFMEDFYKLEDLLFTETGVRPKIMRFPNGSNTPRAALYGGPMILDDIMARLKADGIEYFDWNVNSGDTDAKRVPSHKIVDMTLSGVEGRKNAIILFHDLGTKQTTADALPEIIIGLIEMGYRFEALKEDSYAYRLR